MDKINVTKLKENVPIDVNILPTISFGTIWRYMMLQIVDAKKLFSTAKLPVEGIQVFLNLAMSMS